MGLHSVKRDFFNFSVARKRKDALFFFFIGSVHCGLSWLMRIFWFSRWSDGPDNC